MCNISNQEFIQLATYIKTNYGINLPEHKKSLLVSRLDNVLREKGFESFQHYYQYLLGDRTGEAVITLLNKITTNHTYFLREERHFSYFKDILLPYWESRLGQEKDLRIWSAGCSSGEEPYTLAMLIADYFGMEKNLWDAKILATDISSKALDKARAGIYSKESLINLPLGWKNNYFLSLNRDSYQIEEKIRNEVIFRRFNLMNGEFPFKKKLHVIFCRNVMIYFDADTKRRLVEKFYQFTEWGGYLFIGHSELLNREETAYKCIMPSVYRKG